MAPLGRGPRLVTPYVNDPDFTLHVGDALEVLQAMPAESVHCCVTSPPYWSLRDYGTEGQLGLEPTPDEYVANMVDVFREVRRVLRADGTLWLNMGSSYFGGESYPLREIDAAWLAAVIDGEGCIQIHQQRRPSELNCVDSFQVDLSVGMMTPEVVQRCYEITGLGSCHQQNRGVWDWSVRGQQAAQLLRAIYPYLLGKRKQAALAIMLANDLASRKYGRGNPADPDVMAWRGEIRKAVSDCNQRRGTDFPLIEPKPIALNLKTKDDVGTPHKLYFALRDDGWYARMDIVWGKLNPMPESVTDRPTKAHEYLFLLTKSPRYFYDADAIREPAEWARWGDQTVRKGSNPDGWIKPKTKQELVGKATYDGFNGRWNEGGNPTARNKRSVWEIATAPYPDAHFATFPQALVEPCIKAGTSEHGCCPVCGAPWEREVETPTIPAELRNRDGGSKMDYHTRQTGGGQNIQDWRDANPTRTTGWRPSCDCLCPECAIDSHHDTRMRELRPELRAEVGQQPVPASEVLLAEVREPVQRSGSLWEDQDDEGLHRSPSTGASGSVEAGLCDGAPSRDGEGDGAAADGERSGASPERDQGRQSPGESRGDGEAEARSAAEEATSSDAVSALRRNDRSAESEVRCQGCGTRLVPVAAVVLDCFVGSGTTALVARRLGRRSIGIELNPEYAQLAARRLQQLSLFATETAEA